MSVWPPTCPDCIKGTGLLESWPLKCCDFRERVTFPMQHSVFNQPVFLELTTSEDLFMLWLLAKCTEQNLGGSSSRCANTLRMTWPLIDVKHIQILSIRNEFQLQTIRTEAGDVFEAKPRNSSTSVDPPNPLHNLLDTSRYALISFIACGLTRIGWASFGHTKGNSLTMFEFFLTYRKLSLTVAVLLPRNLRSRVMKSANGNLNHLNLKLLTWYHVIPLS